MLIGLLLVAKGYVYFNNAGYIRELLIRHKLISLSPDVIILIIYYTTYVQLVGGIWIFSVSLYGLPVSFSCPSSLAPSLSPIFYSLFLFIIIGSGPWSVDHNLAKMRDPEKARSVGDKLA